MVLGSLAAENPFCTRVCVSACCVVVAVDYRLAPEHKFPTGSNDAWTGELELQPHSLTNILTCSAFEYLHCHGEELGIDVTRFGIGGSSSGGNLAAMVSHKAGLAGKKVQFVCTNYTGSR
jgi:acetyl esterase/lipase